MNQSYFAPGKLLLSAEYAVLKGVKAIAAPTRFGQHLSVSKSTNPSSYWKALDHQGVPWLDFRLGEAQSKEEVLVQTILKEANQGKHPEALNFETELDFPRNWGLGSSSTFVSLIARWAEQDVWPLFFKHLKGSGYDVAVAETGKNIQYRIGHDHRPEYDAVALPQALDQSLFIYLGQKQNSAREVSRFSERKVSEQHLTRIESLSNALLNLNDLKSLGEWMQEHESITAELIGLEKVKDRQFSGLEGNFKSLGAWGGDFIWYCGPLDHKDFAKIGYSEVFLFKELIKEL